MTDKRNGAAVGFAMGLRRRLPAILVTGLVGAGLVIVGWKAFAPRPQDTALAVAVPRLSAMAVAGKTAFDANCARCHGANGAGTDRGPPLINDIYNPGHHGDGAFFRAAQLGVPQHHWPFGDMPPQPQVSDRQIAEIVRYIR